jgi:hypothetical protein
MQVMFPKIFVFVAKVLKSFLRLINQSTKNLNVTFSLIFRYKYFFRSFSDVVNSSQKRSFPILIINFCPYPLLERDAQR